jgi:hypothetical protein
MNIPQILQSRKDWRKKATDRAGIVRRQNRKLTRVLADAALLKGHLAERNSQVKALNIQLSQLQLASTPFLLKIEVRILCVSLFVLGIVPCNAVVRVLKYLSERGHLSLNWLPDPSSVVNWVARAGLGLLTSIQKVSEPWIAIVDFSICFGKAKALVVLRVPLSAMECAKPLTLEKVECIQIEIREEWNGDSVQKSLDKTFEKSGPPIGILKDGGSDLAKAVRQLVHTHKGLAVIQDIGHVFANLLKSKYTKQTSFLKLLSLADSARKKLCQTDLSPLRPPKIRTKGRFQSISKLVAWAESVLLLIGGQGRSEKDSLKSKLRDVLAGLSKLKSFLQAFKNDCSVLNLVQENLKTNGLNQKSYKAAKDHLKSLPLSSRIRKGALKWLDTQMRIQCRLGIGQSPLPVSSDVIETLMGVLKNIIERHPTPEFTSLTLAAPLLCGPHSSERIHEALLNCPHKSLTSWRLENCNVSVRHKKPNLFGELMPKNCPKSEHRPHCQQQDTC